MLRIVVAVSIIAVCHAGYAALGSGYGLEGGYASSGYGSSYGGGYASSGYGGEGYAREDYASHPIPYAFGYSAQGHDGGSSREESSDGHGGVRGSYTLNVADGRKRTVRYVADHAGFRAEVDTNEPGTESKSPAATLLISHQPPASELANRLGGYGGHGGYGGGYGQEIISRAPLSYGSSYGSYGSDIKY